MLLRYFLFVSSFLLLRSAFAGFIRSDILPNMNSSEVALAPLIIFVAIDVEKQLMKFLINTKVIAPYDSPTAGPLITDVNPATNRYTTLNVEIQFMGKTFVREDLRFCDVLAVKQTSASRGSRGSSGSQSSSVSSSTALSSAAPESTGHVSPGPRGGYSNHSLEEDVYIANNASDLTPRDNGVKIASISNYYVRPSLSKSNASVEALFANLTSSSTSPSCPLYVNDSIVFYYQTNISENLHKFGSYLAKFTIVSNDEDSDIIGGASGYVTSSFTSHNTLKIVFYGAAAIGIFACVAYFMIMVVSPDQESQNPFLIEASAICNVRLLKQLGAQPSSLFSYLQFALFMAGLNLQYPEFFPHMVTQIRWSALLGINVMHDLTMLPAYKRDNVYLTYYPGFRAVALYNYSGYSRYSWANFVVCLLVWTFAGMVGYQMFISFKTLAVRTSFGSMRKVLDRSGSATAAQETARKGSGFRYSLAINVWALIGHFLRQFFTIFSFPFLVLTIYMLVTASRWNSHPEQTVGMTEASAFSSTTPYYSMPANIFSPYAARVLLTKSPGIPLPSVIFGAVSLFAWLAAAFIFLYHYISPVSWRGQKKQHVKRLYSSVRTTVTWAYLYSAYRPSRSYYVAVDLVSCILSSVVIAAMQQFPTAQVALMIVIESVKLFLLFVLRPLFLEMTWYSLPVIMSVARVAITFLNIAYLKQLSGSEVSCSHVAFAQMLIHVIVVFAYALHLLYSLLLTARAIFKAHQARRNDTHAVNGHSHSGSIFSEFEFKQVPPAFLARHKFDASDIQSSIASSVDGREIDYYRASSRAVHGINHHDLLLDNKETRSETVEEHSIDYEESESRIRRTDYTTREGDRIYNKYFTDEEIDPEMRELWKSRDWRNTIKPLPSKSEDVSCVGGKFRKWKALFSPAKKEKGFEVVRRRPIVVSNPALKMDLETGKGDT